MTKIKLHLSFHLFHFPDGRNLPANQRQQVFQNGTLLIRDIMPRVDDGLYSCEVRSHQGVPVSRTFRIAIRSKVHLCKDYRNITNCK